MGRESKFRLAKSSDERLTESQNIMDKHPNSTPIILQSYSLALTRQRFLVPSDMNVSQFKYFIRKKLKIAESHAMFMFVENVNKNREPFTGSTVTLPDQLTTGQVYAKHKHTDGFLYLFVEEENTFGN